MTMDQYAGCVSNGPELGGLSEPTISEGSLSGALSFWALFLSMYPAIEYLTLARSSPGRETPPGAVELPRSRRPGGSGNMIKFRSWPRAGSWRPFDI